ncbi:MAG: hypothetical protein EBZ48_12220 [Proteobacteria bacterium]|nr:hypothetical protein [Pseudomonadota bacterium]
MTSGDRLSQAGGQKGPGLSFGKSGMSEREQNLRWACVLIGMFVGLVGAFLMLVFGTVWSLHQYLPSSKNWFATHPYTIWLPLVAMVILEFGCAALRRQWKTAQGFKRTINFYHALEVLKVLTVATLFVIFLL